MRDTGGGPSRTVSVPASRLAGWLERFAARHGDPAWTATDLGVRLSAPDGATADCRPPFPPLPDRPQLPHGGLVAHVVTPRRVGVLLVRKGGYAAGVFQGETLVSSKVGSRLVQGRTAAGGQSQQRFARRRDNQARQVYDAAAEVAGRILLPELVRLDAIVTGGDHPGVDAVLANPELARLRPLVTGAWLAVAEPRLRILQATPELFGATTITVTDPPLASGQSA